MKKTDSLSNDIKYALQQTQLNIQNELRDYLNKKTRLFYLFNYSHLRQYLPQRFLLKLQYNQPKQIRLPTMTTFQWQEDEDDLNYQAVNLSDFSLYPTKRVDCKLDPMGKLEIEFTTHQAFQFFYDYFDFSLQLIKEDDKEILQWFYSQLIDLKCHVILNFEDNKKVIQSTLLKENNANILPINAQILDKVHSPELSFNIRCNLNQIHANTGSKYVTSVVVVIPKIQNFNQIADYIDKSFTFTHNIVAVYNLRRDFSVTQTLDAHHDQVAIVPKVLKGFNLYQSLSVYINQENFPIYNDDPQVCCDDENQSLSIIFSNDNLDKSVYVDALWTKPFTSNSSLIYCKDINITVSVQLIRAYNQTPQPCLNTVQKIVPMLADVKINTKDNDIVKQLVAFLFTHQLDLNHPGFKKLLDYVNFNKGYIKAKKNTDFYITWKIKHLVDLFLKANKVISS